MEDEEEIFNEKAFLLGLLDIGVHDFDEKMRLLNTAKQCALTTGAKQAVVGAGVGFVAGAAVAGVGEVPGAVVGALVGMIRGTKSCMRMNAQEVQEVRIFASGQ